MRISDWSSDVCSSDFVLLASAVIVGYDNYKYRTQQAGEVSAQAEILISGMIAPLEFQDSATAQEYLNSLEANRAITAGAVYEADGTLFSSEERRVGKECVSTCRSRWST